MAPSKCHGEGASGRREINELPRAVFCLGEWIFRCSQRIEPVALRMRLEHFPERNPRIRCEAQDRGPDRRKSLQRRRRRLAIANCRGGRLMASATRQLSSARSYAPGANSRRHIDEARQISTRWAWHLSIAACAELATKCLAALPEKPGIMDLHHAAFSWHSIHAPAPTSSWVFALVVESVPEAYGVWPAGKLVAVAAKSANEDAGPATRMPADSKIVVKGVIALSFPKPAALKTTASRPPFANDEMILATAKVPLNTWRGGSSPARLCSPHDSPRAARRPIAINCIAGRPGSERLRVTQARELDNDSTRAEASRCGCLSGIYLKVASPSAMPQLSTLVGGPRLPGEPGGGARLPDEVK